MLDPIAEADALVIDVRGNCGGGNHAAAASKTYVALNMKAAGIKLIGPGDVTHDLQLQSIGPNIAGTVVASRKDEGLAGRTLLLLRTLDAQGEATGAPVVAVDAVGAGEGEYVLYASGSSARQTSLTEAKPVDAVVMAIVDSWDIEGEDRYRKGDD